MKTIEQIKNEWPDNDTARWQYLAANQDQELIVYLDNDDTFVSRYGDSTTLRFDEFLGWSSGVFSLLDAVGIRSESV